MKNKIKYALINSYKKNIAIGVVILLLCIGLIAYSIFLSKPEPSYPLGSELKYIGKLDYGCDGFCDSSPNSTYYYATKLTVDEVEEYFQKATLHSPTTQESTSVRIWLDSKTHDDDFILSYYDDNSAVVDNVNIKPTAENVVAIPKSMYTIAKDSL